MHLGEICLLNLNTIGATYRLTMLPLLARCLQLPATRNYKWGRLGALSLYILLPCLPSREQAEAANRQDPLELINRCLQLRLQFQRCPTARASTMSSLRGPTAFTYREKWLIVVFASCASTFRRVRILHVYMSCLAESGMLEFGSARYLAVMGSG